MQNQSALERVAAAFEHWRQTRLNSVEKIPDELRRQAVALLEHYRLSQIMQTLRVNSTQLKTWRNLLSSDIELSPAFITLPIEPEPEPESAPVLNLAVSLPGGCQLRLQGDIRPELMSALTHSLMLAVGERP